MSGSAVFGHWLQQRRKSLKLTQDRLATLCACSTATIRKIEADERRPSSSVAERLADSLEIPEGERETFLRFARGGWSDDPAVTPEEAPTPLPWTGPASKQRAAHLPLPLTELLGQEPLLESVIGLVRRPAVRLVTLTGSGGIGKTHVALEVAHRLKKDYPDGVHFALLAPVHDAERLPSAVANVFAVQESGSNPLWDRVKDHLQEKRLLLVLDNFEQIIAAAPLVSDLLQACAGVEILVTSREVLRVPGEYEVVVPPLGAPAIDSPMRFGPDKAASYPAVELFMQRAQAARPEFTLTIENASVVGELCARLDGLPLAIELAAARVRLFSPGAMLARLSHALDLLTGGSRDAPDRQRTMRQAIAWSYELLDDEERRLLRRLSVFFGGFTLEAAAAVGLPERTLLDTIASLIEKSLLRSNGGEEPRFVMLETIREYGVEMLGQHGEEAQVRDLHADYFADFMSRIEPDFYGPKQAMWISVAASEHSNIRAALRWSMGLGESSTALRLATASWWYWYVRGHITEGRSIIAELLTVARNSNMPISSKLLLGAARLAMIQNDGAKAAALYKEAEIVSKRCADGAGQASAVVGLSCVSILEGDLAAAEQYADAGLAKAMACGQEREIGLFLNTLGEIARARGENEKAKAHYEESLGIQRRLDDRVCIMTLLENLGYIAQRQHDLSQSAARFGEGLRLASEIGDMRLTAAMVAGLAGVAALTESTTKAAMLFGTVKAVYEEHGIVPVPVDREDMERNIAYGMASVTPELWASCTTEGMRMSVEEAVAVAFEVEAGTADTPTRT